MSDILVYEFDRYTRIFTKEKYIKERPSGVSYPDNVVLVEPLKEKENYCVVAKGDNSGWKYMEDHIGEAGSLNGKLLIIDMPGPYPEGWDEEPPKDYLESIKNARTAKLRAEYREKILSGFNYEIGGKIYHFGYDDEDQLNFSKANSEALMYIALSLPDYNREWRGWDGDTPVVFNFTIEEYLNISLYAHSEHQLSHQKKSWELEAAIKDAKTLKELNKIYP